MTISILTAPTPDSHRALAALIIKLANESQNPNQVQALNDAFALESLTHEAKDLAVHVMLLKDAQEVFLRQVIAMLIEIKKEQEASMQALLAAKEKKEAKAKIEEKIQDKKDFIESKEERLEALARFERNVMESKALEAVLTARRTSQIDYS